HLRGGMAAASRRLRDARAAARADEGHRRSAYLPARTRARGLARRRAHGSRRPVAGQRPGGEQLTADVLAEAAIALPLRLVEGLVGGALLREVRMARGVLDEVERL